MQIIKVEQNTPEWLQARKGKITGSKLKDIVVKRGTGKKLGFYELVADRLSVDAEYENPMERGHSLEVEARCKFEEMIGKVVFDESVMLISDKNPNIAVSPDGLIKDKSGKFTEALEIKCLSGARHLQAYFEQEIPDEYEAQVCQYFIVNEDLQKLYFVFYDPRIEALPMFYIEVTREEKESDIKFYEEYQIRELKEVDALVDKLLKF